MTPSCTDTSVSVHAESKFEDINRKLHTEYVECVICRACICNLNLGNLIFQLSNFVHVKFEDYIEQISELSKKK